MPSRDANHLLRDGLEGESEDDDSSSDDGATKHHKPGASLTGGPRAVVGTHHHRGEGIRTMLSSKVLRGDCLLGCTLPGIAMITAWVVYLFAAMLMNPQDAWPLATMTAVCLVGTILSRTGKLTEIREALPAVPPQVSWGILAVLALIMLVMVGVQVVPDSPERSSRQQALIGTVVLIAACTALSQKVRNIPWDVVLSAGLLQFFMGVFVMRTEVGMTVFKEAGNAVSYFLDFSNFGASFVFGDGFQEHFFAFKVLPTIVFFSAFISSMYYMGVMQVTVRIISLLLKKTVGTSLVQSVNAAANLFLGQTEAPLLIKPFLPKASPCDIHCVMVGGFASIAGGVLAAYIGMGVKAEQLIGASVMSVPGTLLVSNLVCPPGSMEGEEGEEGPEGNDDEHFEFPPSSENNIIEAAGNGAHLAIDLVLNIGAMLIAFFSLLKVINMLLGYLGGLVDVPDLCFDMICGTALWPLAWLLGTPHQDCYTVARLIGTKIFANEFLAYSDLAKLLKDPDEELHPRAELAATYALCGFSNIGSIGVQLGCLAALCPERSRVFAKLVVSAMISGNVVCFLTATVAGILN